MEEILKVEAHDAEILCLEYSKPETGQCVCVCVSDSNEGRLEEYFCIVCLYDMWLSCPITVRSEAAGHS